MNPVDLQRLNPSDLAIAFIDHQPRVLTAMFGKSSERVVRNARILAQAAAEFNLPIIVTEQYSKGLGNTAEELREVLPVYQPIEKLHFDCTLEPAFMQALEATGKKQVIISGVEAHVCLYQSCLGLLSKGYQVFCAADAVSSRKRFNWRNALENMRLAGAAVESTEMLVFQLADASNKEVFKKLSSWVK